MQFRRRRPGRLRLPPNCHPRPTDVMPGSFRVTVLRAIESIVDVPRAGVALSMKTSFRGGLSWSVVPAESACPAGGRGFDSCRSRSPKLLQTSPSVRGSAEELRCIWGIERALDHRQACAL